MEGEEQEEDGEVEDGDRIFVTQIHSEEEWIPVHTHIHSDWQRRLRGEVEEVNGRDGASALLGAVPGGI